MTWVKEQQAVEGKFTGWTACPVKYPNKPFNEPNGPYLALTILDGAAIEATIGTPMQRRHVGVVSCQIFNKENSGEAKIRELADQVEALFINAGSRTVISATEYIDYATPSLSTLQILNGWAQRNLTINFFRDEFK